jgi:hypothetical protein
MRTKLLLSAAAGVAVLVGTTDAMAQSNQRRQGPPAAAISRPAPAVSVAPRAVQVAPRIQAVPRPAMPSRAAVQRLTTGQEERARRTTITGTRRVEQLRQERTLQNAPVGRTTTGAGTANTNLRDQRNLERRNVVVPPSAVVPPNAGRQTTGAAAGATNRGARATAALSAPQRTRLVQTIKESRNLNRVRRADFRVAVGSRLPRRFHLAPLPLAFFAIVPEYRGYEYVYVEDDDDIVIVDPDSYTVVDVIPASAEPGERVVVRSSLTFSQREREIIRRAALSERSTEGAAGDVDIVVGSAVPRSITLTAFPDDLYAQIPQLSPLRFVVVRDEVLLVDPEDRRIVYVID